MNFGTMRVLFADRDQVQDGLGVRGRGKDRAARLQFALHGQGVGDVAIVGDREAAPANSAKNGWTLRRPSPPVVE
jgi:hypothetical protein